MISRLFLLFFLLYSTFIISQNNKTPFYNYGFNVQLPLYYSKHLNSGFLPGGIGFVQKIKYCDTSEEKIKVIFRFDEYLGYDFFSKAGVAIGVSPKIEICFPIKLNYDKYIAINFSYGKEWFTITNFDKSYNFFNGNTFRLSYNPSYRINSGLDESFIQYVIFNNSYRAFVIGVGGFVEYNNVKSSKKKTTKKIDKKDKIKKDDGYIFE